MSLTLSISNSLSGLGVAQRAIEVVSNNVANVNNPDFVRQEISLAARNGGGADVTEIKRFVDRLFVGRALNARTDAAGAGNEAQLRQRLEDIIAGGDEATRLDSLIGGLRADVSRAAASPSDNVLRQAVVMSADKVARKLNQAAAELAALTRDLDTRYADLAGQLDTTLQSLGKLNIAVMATSVDPGQLRNLEDRRDAMVNRMAQMLPIKTFERPARELAVFAGGSRPLLDKNVATIGTTTLDGVKRLTIDGEIADRDIVTGEIGAIRLIRDQAVPAMLRGLDEIAAEVASAVNQAHNGSVSSTGRDAWTSAYAMGSFQSVDLADTKLVLRDGNGRAVTALALATTSTPVQSFAGLKAAIESIKDPGNKSYVLVSQDSDGRITLRVNPESRAAGLDLDFVSASGTTGLRQALHLDDMFVGAAGADSFAHAVGAGSSGTALKADGNPSWMATLVGREIALEDAGGGSVLRRAMSWDPATGILALDGAIPAGTLRFRGFVPSAATIAVRADLLADPTTLATARADASTDLTGMLVAGAGDGRGLEAMIAALDTNRAVLDDPGQRQSTIARLARDQIAQVAIASADAEARRSETDAVSIAFTQQFGTQSGVNVDEEMAQLILLQNAYAASARILSSISDLFQRLMQI